MTKDAQIIAHLIVIDPEKAKAKLIAAYKRESLHQGRVWAKLGVAESTLIKWVSKLGLKPALDDLRAEARAKGKYKFGRPEGARDLQARKPRAKRGE